MEQIFKFIQSIIKNKDKNYKKNTTLLKKCKEIDNLVEKRFVFENKPEIHEYKSYNTKIKYLMKNFFYKKIHLYLNYLKESNLNFDESKENYKQMLKNKEMKEKMHHPYFPKQIVLMYNILSQCIFQSHCLTVLSTMPVYSPKEFHTRIYNICLEIDNILENEEYKEIYYYVLLQFFLYLEDLGDKVVYSIESKLIHSKEYKGVKKTQKFILERLEELYSENF